METRVNDLLLLYHDTTPLGYARVEDISPDVKRGWWQLSMLLLQIPPQHITWILREEYIDGEPFSMGGRQMRLERMPRVGQAVESREPAKPAGGEPGKVIKLRPRVTRPPEDDDIA